RPPQLRRGHARERHHRPGHRLAVDDADRRRDGDRAEPADPRRRSRGDRDGRRLVRARRAAPQLKERAMAGPTTRMEERLYRIYMEFFEKAERERRWSVFDDVPWDKI